MNTPDYIFDTAMARLEKGESLFAITESYPEYQPELGELLQIAQLAKSVPKAAIPTPHKQFKFTQVTAAPYYFAEFFQVARMAVIPVSLVLVLVGGNFMVNATENSLPGDKLYTVKRASEEARLNLARNEETVALINVELTQKRLEEVKKAITENNPEAETAAIAALQAQTEKTFATVPQVAAVSAVTKNDSSLLDTLVAINKEQKSLLETIEDKDAIKVALDTTKTNEETVARVIATVNEQTLIDLPNKISITGTPTLISETKVVVEKNTFIIDAETEITTQDGNKITTIPTNASKITVIGSRTEQAITAKQVIILATEPVEVTPEPTVKGTTTPKPTTQPTETTKPPIDPAPEPTATPPTNEASGTYIAEPSDQQYAQ